MEGLFGAYKVLLAPMAGVTDVAFRTLCARMGADLTYTEMVSAKGLSFANDKTRHLLEVGPEEDKVAVQIFGHESDVMAAQAAWIEEEMGDSLAYIDINMGCPARKIVSKGDGSALMKDPPLAARIVRAVKGAVSHPVTCKFRRGWERTDDGKDECVSFAKRMEEAGADGVVVHGRYALQMYHGSSDRACIKAVKEAVSIPVVGNGDIGSGAAAVAMNRETGCDAVMVGRAAEGDPWVFAEISCALAGQEPPVPPSARERLSLAKAHATMLAERQGNDIRAMRKHAMWYVSGLPGASAARRRFSQCTTLEDFAAVFDELAERIETHGS